MYRKVLFLPSHNATFQEMLRIALFIKERNIAKPIIVIERQELLEHIGLMEKNHLDFIILCKDGDNNSMTIISTYIKKIKNLIKKQKLIKNFVISLKMQFELTSYFSRKKKKNISFALASSFNRAKDILLQVQPHSVVVTGDRSSSGLLPGLLKACKEFNISSIIPPIAYAATPESLVVLRRSRIFNADHFPVLKKKYPEQYIYDKKTAYNIFFFPPFVTEALAENGMLPENPWVMGGGYSNFVLADGEETKERYVRLGANPDKIIITGHPSHDRLYEQYIKKSMVKEDLVQKYNLDKTKKIIILSLPQLAEHNVYNWDIHWKEINFLCRIFSNVDANVLISLHPKMKYETYKFIEQQYKIYIAKEKLADILPVADIFSATFSSTVQWAVLCEIPAIVFDFYGLNYTCYDF